MARKPKTGLDYFPLDTDFFDDVRVSAVTVGHGATGMVATVMLLCAIYKNGYYLLWDKEARVTVAQAMPGITLSELDAIVATLVEWDFFDHNLFEQYGVLTSSDIQRRFFHAAKRRKYDPMKQHPFLIGENEKEVNSAPATPTCDKTCAARPKSQKSDMTAEKAFMSTETTKMSAETTQKNLRKNIIKVNDIDYPSSPARVRESAQSQEPCLTVDEEVAHLKTDDQWTDVMCMRHHLTRRQLHERLDEFALDCTCRGKVPHPTLAEARSHFCNWLLIRTRETEKQNINHQNISYHANHQHTKTPQEHIADAQQWAIERTLHFLQSPKEPNQGISEHFLF